LPEAVRWTVLEGGKQEEIEFSWVGETARHVGTVVHRWLQRIAQDEMRGWNAAGINALQKHFAGELRRRGVSSKDIELTVERVAVALQNSLTDESGRWLLGPQRESKTEYRLRTSGAATYVVDRSFRDVEGRLWIVDWKTSQHEGRDLEAFLDREQLRYAPQLERYGAAIAATHVGLYFPVLRRWRTWSRKGVT
jgi:ATP-dependent exoDNAse (exonuclease V) beta subunit